MNKKEKIQQNLKELTEYFDDVKCGENCIFESICSLGDYMMPCEMIKVLHDCVTDLNGDKSNGQQKS